MSTVPDSTHITVATLANSHAAKIGVSALPPRLKWGVILACLHFARIRGTDAVTFVSESGSVSRGSSGETSDALSEAEAVLDDFRRFD